jgi:hypothetical protein
MIKSSIVINAGGTIYPGLNKVNHDFTRIVFISQCQTNAGETQLSGSHRFSC